MTIDYRIPTKVKLIQEALMVRHALEFEVDRPVQAWQWMNQTRSIPDHRIGCRSEVVEGGSAVWKTIIYPWAILPIGHNIL